MGIEFVGAEWAKTISDSETQITVNVPSAAVADDLLLFFVNGCGNGVGTWSEVSGLNQIVQNLTTEGRDISTSVYWKFHSGLETNYTFTNTVAEYLSASCVAFSGVDLTTPFDVAYSNASHHLNGSNDSTPPNPSITTVTDSAIAITSFVYTTAELYSVVPPVDYDLLVSNITGLNQNLGVSAKEIVSAGLESPGSWRNTFSASTGEWHSYTLAIRPEEESSTHNLYADGLDVTLELDTSEIAQTHVLSAAGIQSGIDVGTSSFYAETDPLDIFVSVTLGAPSSTGTPDDLIADSVRVQPKIGRPFIGQTHILVSNSIKVNTDLEVPSLGQINTVYGLGLVTGVILDRPVIVGPSTGMLTVGFTAERLDITKTFYNLRTFFKGFYILETFFENYNEE